MSRAAEPRPAKVALDALLADLSPLPVTARAMFGGYGLYMQGQFLGLVSSEGVAYFRTDQFSRAGFESRGMGPFQPNNRPAGPKTMPRNFQVPPEILGDGAALRDWALRAAAAQR